jgi:hypothetical protein
MEPQIWLKTEEKSATFLVLNGHMVHKLKVSGNMLTLKRNTTQVLEALQQGRAPAEAGAKSVETLDAQTIGKATVSPGNGSLTLTGESDGPKSLTFSTSDNNADQIMKAILDQSGKSFQPTQEEIGVVEALIPPIIIGLFGGLFWAGVNQAANELAAGKAVEVKGFRRRGLQKFLIMVAETLGTTGTMALGILLAVLILGWAGMRLVKRPQRTVWLPQSA